MEVVTREILEERLSVSVKALEELTQSRVRLLQEADRQLQLIHAHRGAINSFQGLLALLNSNGLPAERLPEPPDSRD